MRRADVPYSSYTNTLTFVTALRGSLGQCGNVAIDPNLTQVRSVVNLLAHVDDIILGPICVKVRTIIEFREA